MIFPYIVYGDVKLNSVLQSGATVTATNNTKGGSTSETSDASGHYEIDLSNMTNGYDIGDEIAMTYSTLEHTFTVDAGFEYERLMSLWVDSANVNISITPAIDEVAWVMSANVNISITPAVSTEIQVSANVDISITPLAPHYYIFFDIDNFNIESWTVSKSIMDALWKFSGQIDGHDLPSAMKNFKASMNDHNDVSRLLFVGIFPGAKYAFKIAANKAQLEGYDHGWYLAAQKVPATIRITDKTTNPADTVKTLLGAAAWRGTCGIDPDSGNITDVAAWASIQKQFEWKSSTKKQKVIDEITDYVDSVFHLKFQTIGGGHYPVAYFVANADIDGGTGLDLPAKVTFTSPDPHLIDVSKEYDESEKANRVAVHAVNRETGAWKSSTTETAGVAAGDELPIEMVIDVYVVEPPPASEAALQTAADAKAAELYALFYTNATTTIISARLKKRADLELWQKVAFSGYSDIPTDDMRIVAIEYSHSVVDDVVTIQCIPVKDLSADKARRMALKDDSISGMQDIVTDALMAMPENEIGEVTAIVGDVATVELEKDGKTIEARII